MTCILLLILCDELMILLDSLVLFFLLWTWFSLLCLNFLHNLLRRFCRDKLWFSETTMIRESGTNMFINERTVLLGLFYGLGFLLNLNYWRCFFW
jgi:hypothetical protein